MASAGRTTASSKSRKLQPLVDQLADMQTFFDNMQTLVDDEILTQVESDAVTDAYKSTVSDYSTEIQTEEDAHADDIETAGVIETDDKCEDLVALAANGAPVITPIPSVIAAEKVTLLSDQTALEATVTSQIAQINGVVG
jgi:hypothetical protein